MADLTPSAQVVRDAYKKGGLDAALRAAADQVVPPSLEAEFCNRNPSLTLQKVVEIRADFLALDTELDPTP